MTSTKDAAASPTPVLRLHSNKHRHMVPTQALTTTILTSAPGGGLLNNTTQTTSNLLSPRMLRYARCRVVPVPSAHLLAHAHCTMQTNSTLASACAPCVPASQLVPWQGMWCLLRRRRTHGDALCCEVIVPDRCRTTSEAAAVHGADATRATCVST